MLSRVYAHLRAHPPEITGWMMAGSLAVFWMVDFLAMFGLLSGGASAVAGFKAVAFPLSALIGLSLAFVAAAVWRRSRAASAVMWIGSGFLLFGAYMRMVLYVATDLNTILAEHYEIGLIDVFGIPFLLLMLSAAGFKDAFWPAIRASV